MSLIDTLLDRAAHDLADGRAIDWDDLIERVQTPEDREYLECLRIVGAIAEVHRSVDDSLSTVTGDRRAEESSPSTLDAGGSWGRYTLLEEVGSGSYGSVYRARDPDLERDTAIKILHRHVADSQLKERLLREGRALARVNHPNIVRVIGVESHNDRVGLCMEFVKGETLESIVRTLGKMNAREATLVGEEVCRALAAVHHAGFVHRDVKAHNIMREEGGRVLLMDFGTGRNVEDDTSVRRVAVAGTPLYMAPEVLAGGPAEACSDVYSVGVLLYYLVTADYPIAGRSLADLRAAHMQGRRVPLIERRPDLPFPFVQVVEHALEPNPQRRCPSAAVMLEALGQVSGTTRATAAAVTWALGLVSGGLVALVALGAVNSRYFNVTLARSDFADESLLDWLYWGITSSVAPTVVLVGVVLSVALLNVCRQFLTGVSTSAHRLEAAILARARGWRLNELSTLSMLALVLSSAALVGVWWRFVPFVSALIAIPDISTAPIENVGFLSPQLRNYHDSYRSSFTGVVILGFVLWAPLIVLAIRRREALNGVVLAGGAAVLTLALLLLDFPYRVLAWDKRNFEGARWQGDNCYVLGERADDVLLFCPALPAPRNRVVPRRAVGLERTGVMQDIFTNVPPPR